MTPGSLAYPNLVTALWPARGAPRLRRAAAIVVCASLLLAVAAKVQIPFWPVPMTMQTFAVLVIGMSCGPRLGAAAVAAYLLEGAAGLPVFAGGAGLAYLAGPTAGYLAGFLLAAVLMGAMAARGFDRNVPRALFAMFVGDLVILGCGVAWLSVLLGSAKALALGLTPFIAGEVAKIVLAAAVLPGVWRLVGKGRPG